MEGIKRKWKKVKLNIPLSYISSVCSHFIAMSHFLGIPQKRKYLRKAPDAPAVNLLESSFT